MSTGTNKERIEQNNTLLEDIKTQIQNLPEAGSSGGIKQFSTVEEMQSDTTSKEGDLAIVYRNEVQNATVDSKFQTATFPDTVVLDTAITNSIEVRYRAVDSSKMFDCMGSLNRSRFRMDCYTESGNIRIQYTSSDGITYTRTDTTGNPVDFGTEIYYERPERWNDAIGKFIQIGGKVFEGLYEYGKYVDKDYVQFIPVSSVSFNFDNNSNVSDVTWDGTKLSTRYNVSELVGLIDSLYTDTSFGGNGAFVFLGTDDMLYSLIVNTDKSTCGTIFFNSNKEVIGIGTGDSNINYSAILYKIDITNKLVTNMREYSPSYINYASNSYKNYYYPIIPKSYPLLVMKSSTSNMQEIINQNWLMIGEANSSTVRPGFYSKIGDLYIPYIEYNTYSIAPTQLSAISDYVYEKEFYGQNGVESGTLQNKENLTKDEVKHRVDIWSNYNSGIVCPSDISNMFENCSSLTTIPLLDTSSVTDMQYMFMDCKNLTTIPQLATSSVTNMQYMFYGCTSLTTIPLLDTHNVTTMYCMFHRCTSLTTIPLLDTHNVTTMYDMFYGCTSLTTIPLLDTSSVTTMFHVFDKCTSLTTIPELDTSSVTNMQYMFNECTSLTTIPLLDTSNVTNMQNMFGSCTSLSDESLNKILTMCTNATKITSNKTLKYIGLTSEQANKCKTLSNYSAFTSVGWTTGY